MKSEELPLEGLGALYPISVRNTKLGAWQLLQLV